MYPVLRNKIIINALIFAGVNLGSEKKTTSDTDEKDTQFSKYSVYIWLHQ